MTGMEFKMGPNESVTPSWVREDMRELGAYLDGKRSSPVFTPRPAVDEHSRSQAAWVLAVELHQIAAVEIHDPDAGFDWDDLGDTQRQEWYRRARRLVDMETNHRPWEHDDPRFLASEY